MATCTTCSCDPCACANCVNCGCDTCDGDCSDPLYAPIKECVPDMINPSHALGLDCDRRKRTIANKVKGLLTSNGNTVKFSDGSEDDRIALALVESAYAQGIITQDGSGQLQVTIPKQDGTDYYLGFVDNVLGFHNAPDNGNRFKASTVETRSCGSLALIICGADGYAKIAKFKGCDQAAGVIVPLGIDSDGQIACIEAEEETEVEVVQSTCRANFLVPMFLDVPSLVVDKWPGQVYPWTDGTVGPANGSFNIPANLPDHDKIKRLILYVESGTFHQISGHGRDIHIAVNGERIHHDWGSVDQIGVSAGGGVGGSSNEATPVHDGANLGSAATWSVNGDRTMDHYWKFKLYVKGAYYDHCDYAHSEVSE